MTARADIEVAAGPVVEVSEDDVLALYAERMRQWGHEDSGREFCEPVRPPTAEEVRRVLATSRYARDCRLRLAE